MGRRPEWPVPASVLRPARVRWRCRGHSVSVSVQVPWPVPVRRRSGTAAVGVGAGAASGAGAAVTLGTAAVGVGAGAAAEAAGTVTAVAGAVGTAADGVDIPGIPDDGSGAGAPLDLESGLRRWSRSPRPPRRAPNGWGSTPRSPVAKPRRSTLWEPRPSANRRGEPRGRHRRAHGAGSGLGATPATLARRMGFPRSRGLAG